MALPLLSLVAFPLIVDKEQALLTLLSHTLTYIVQCNLSKKSFILSL